MRSPTRIIAATTLTCEALVVIFAGLVAKDLSELSLGAALGISAVLAVACLVTAGMLRSRRGYVVGSLLQLLIIGYGFWLPTMFIVGTLFTALWILALVLGTRAEREAERRWGKPSAGGRAPLTASPSGPLPDADPDPGTGTESDPKS
jgi:uncharacterized protein DUF4233